MPSFLKQIPPKCPVVLLWMVMGHTWVFFWMVIGQFCKAGDIVLYCLPPHTSHVTQPFAVDFFKPLKLPWRETVSASKPETLV